MGGLVFKRVSSLSRFCKGTCISLHRNGSTYNDSQAYMLGQNNPDFCDIVKRVKAVLFLSTPHRGTNLAITLNRILSVSFAGHTQKQYISDLSKNSGALEDLNENFRHVALRLRVFSFYETLETTIALKAVVCILVSWLICRLSIDSWCWTKTLPYLGTLGKYQGLSMQTTMESVNSTLVKTPITDQ